MAVVCVGACSHVPKEFEILEEPVGTPISVEGYLKFDTENMNLYPNENWQKGRSDGHCIPVGVSVQDDAIIETARRLRNGRVRISGTVGDLVADDEVSIAYCKEFGILVTAISRVGAGSPN